MKTLIAMIMFTLTVAAIPGSEAFALAPFKKAFQKKYIDDASAEMKAAFKKESCNVCHVKGEKKDVRNEYGDELAKLIEGDAKERMDKAKEAGGVPGFKAEQDVILKELEVAFEEVEKMKDKAGEVYGETLNAGKLPVTAE